jgi:predicted metalloprotease
VLLVLSVVFKRDFLSLAVPGALEPVATGSDGRVTRSAAAEDSLAQFVSFVLDDAQDTWTALFRATGRTYTPATLVLYRDETPTACGTGQSASGPFYCPADQQVYIDLAFFDELHRRFDAAGDFAQAYVLAHEIGHHVQTITGTSQQVRQMQQRNPSQGNALSVQQELQADCYAGVWAHATNRRQLMEPGDLEEGLRAAAAVGDDRLSGGRRPRESFTHGSSAERAAWFRRGFESGRPEECDTFNPGRGARPR